MTFILVLTIWRDILALYFNRAVLSLVKEDRAKEGLKKGGVDHGLNLGAKRVQF